MPAVKRLKTAQINLKILPDLKEKAEEAAARDGRTLTNLIEKLLRDFIDAQPRRKKAAN